MVLKRSMLENTRKCKEQDDIVQMSCLGSDMFADVMFVLVKVHTPGEDGQRDCCEVALCTFTRANTPHATQINK